VADFIVQECGRTPEPGEELLIRDLAAEIESVEGGRITSLIVTPPRAADEEGDGRGAEGHVGEMDSDAPGAER
jgi:CBS domain containing-hemolysin-like protein